MKRQIIDGTTVISTGIAADVIRNKTGVRGLTWRESLNCYVLAFVVNGKKYHIGNYDTIEEGKSMRKIADEMVANGTFHDWLHDLRLNRKERANSRRLKQNR